MRRVPRFLPRHGVRSKQVQMEWVGGWGWGGGGEGLPMMVRTPRLDWSASGPRGHLWRRLRPLTQHQTLPPPRTRCSGDGLKRLEYRVNEWDEGELMGRVLLAACWGHERSHGCGAIPAFGSPHRATPRGTEQTGETGGGEGGRGAGAPRGVRGRGEWARPPPAGSTRWID